MRRLEVIENRDDPPNSWAALEQLEDRLHGQLLQAFMLAGEQERPLLERAAVPLLLGLALQQARANASLSPGSDLSAFERLMATARESLKGKCELKLPS